jgi:hypothetical protein
LRFHWYKSLAMSSFNLIPDCLQTSFHFWCYQVAAVKTFLTWCWCASPVCDGICQWCCFKIVICFYGIMPFYVNCGLLGWPLCSSQWLPTFIPEVGDNIFLSSIGNSLNQKTTINIFSAVRISYFRCILLVQFYE